MSPEECTFAYEQLSGFLREMRCKWILSEVEETIALGRIKSGKAVDYEAAHEPESAERQTFEKGATLSVLRMMLPEHAELLDGVADTNPAKRPRRGRPVDIQKVEEFDAGERLQLLLVAIQRVFVGLPEMEASTAAILKSISPQVEAIVIDNERGDEISSIDLLEGASRRASAEALAKAIQRMNGMVK